MICRWRSVWVVGLLLIAGCTQTPTSPSQTMPGAVVGNAPQTTVPAPPAISANPTDAIGVTRFVAFGDSLTWGAQSAFDPRFLFAAANGAYSDYLQSKLIASFQPHQFVIYNEGVPGELAANALTRFRNMLTNRRPGAVLLLEGINDLNNDLGVTRTVDALQRMVDAALSSGVPVLVATMFQTYESTGPDDVTRPNSNGLIGQFNNAIKSRFSGRLNVHIVDLQPHISRSMVGNDGLHLTDQGYERMADVFKAAIQTAFPVRGSFQ